MLRTVLGCVAAVAIGMAWIMLWETLGHYAGIASPGTNLLREGATGAAAWIVAGWTGGAFVGGLAGARIARRGSPAWIAAALIVAAVIATARTIPHPVWMLVAGVLLPPVGAWLAIRAARVAKNT